MIKKTQYFLLRLPIALFGTIIALVLIELGARWLGLPFEEKPDEMYVCDQQLGWKGKADLVTPVNSEGYQHSVIRNSLGMHDTEHQLEKEENSFRILVLGDSFVDAIQVSEAETSHQLLEDALNGLSNSGLRFEVINAGISAWGPAQELVYFHSVGQRYEPDLILSLWVPANDLLDILPDYPLTYDGKNCYAPYFVVCEDRFDPEPWYSVPGIRPIWKSCPGPTQKPITYAFNQLYYFSYLYQHLEPILAQRYHRIEYAHPYAPWLGSNQTDEILQHAYKITTEIYSQLAAESAKIGARTALVIVPAKQAVYAEVDPSSVILAQSDLGELDPDLPNQIFTELMQPIGLPVLNLQPYFVEYLQQNGEEVYWKRDSHWNVRGNELVAEVIVAWLIEERLVPVSY